MVIRKLTRNPESVAGKELKTLVKTLKQSHKNDFYDMHSGYNHRGKNDIVKNCNQYGYANRCMIIYGNDKVIYVKNGEILLTLSKPCLESVWNGENWIVPKHIKDKRLIKQKAEIWEQIKAKRYAAAHGGIYVTSVGKWFHTDETSRIQYLSLQQLPQLPENLMWKTMDNSFIAMTKAILDELILTMIENEQINFAVAEKHKIAMEQTENPLDYDYSSGWSDIYE